MSDKRVKQIQKRERMKREGDISTTRPSTNTTNTTKTWWDDERMSHDEVAAMLGIKTGSLSSGLSRGLYHFKRYKVGRRYWYRKSEVLASIVENHAA